ncbi:Predicted PurR-regulated permease PerM [Raineyella antarctica]|uniref:Predicted PurR-regulated permease PerM n=1 Tax=Raineyella antarctica TaxID=1577474 RepID=A0A1G6GDX8_9ACTN|nr:AI-2E family transporter [Raineyella antarctica]SDB79945.1 Predicted PurR-regulated permease PerM [Raineyella antarctica]
MEPESERTGQPLAVLPGAEPTGSAAAVPAGIRVAASWTWRLLLIGVGVVVVGYVFRYFSGLAIPLAVAVLLAALLAAPKAWLVRHGFNKALASGLTLVVGLALVVGVLTGVVAQMVSEGPKLFTSAQTGLLQLVTWLSEGPLKLAPEQVQGMLNDQFARIPGRLQQWSGQIVGVAAGVGSGVASFFAGMFTALFALFFFLYSGRLLWAAFVRIVPARVRPAVDRGGTVGWKALTGYVRTTVIVAAVDAVGITIGAVALNIPLAGAIGALTFIGAFVPIVGAFVAGVIGVLIALVTKGWVAALILLGVVLAVQQLEGNVLQPFLMGKAVSLHPLAILLGISVGVTLGGIAGAVVAVPVLAFAKAFVDSLTHREWLALAPAPDLRLTTPDIVASNALGGGTEATLALQLDPSNTTTAELTSLRVAPVSTSEAHDAEATARPEGSEDDAALRRGDEADGSA